MDLTTRLSTGKKPSRIGVWTTAYIGARQGADSDAASTATAERPVVDRSPIRDHTRTAAEHNRARFSREGGRRTYVESSRRRHNGNLPPGVISFGAASSPPPPPLPLSRPPPHSRSHAPYVDMFESPRSPRPVIINNRLYNEYSSEEDRGVASHHRRKRSPPRVIINNRIYNENSSDGEEGPTSRYRRRQGSRVRPTTNGGLILGQSVATNHQETSVVDDLQEPPNRRRTTSDGESVEESEEDLDPYDASRARYDSGRGNR